MGVKWKIVICCRSCDSVCGDADDRQLIQPKMVGDSIGMDAMTTLIFLFIGYRMAGLIGMIVAIPSGLILIQLYEAGAFAGVIASVRELADDMHRLRTGK